MPKPVFILGIGAQKAGTTWLHNQLDHQQSVNMGCLKEYHIWDAKFIEHQNSFLTPPKKKEQCDSALRRIMQTTNGVYESYFSQLISKTIRYTGDITPSYSMLRAQDFKIIRARLKNAGFLVKVVFIMRDPVERNWSALRMHQRRRQHIGNYISDGELNLMFEKFYKGAARIGRTNYPATINALADSFPADDIHIGFYESMFDQEEIDRLSKFLGLDLSSLNTNKLINVSRQIELRSELRDQCKLFYNNVYDYCGLNYPKSKELWCISGQNKSPTYRQRKEITRSPTSNILANSDHSFHIM